MTTEPAALLSLTGSARRESAPENIAVGRDHGRPTSLSTVATANALATEQQLEAERVAAETVKTRPVRL